MKIITKRSYLCFPLLVCLVPEQNSYVQNSSSTNWLLKAVKYTMGIQSIMHHRWIKHNAVWYSKTSVIFGRGSWRSRLCDKLWKSVISWFRLNSRIWQKYWSVSCILLCRLRGLIEENFAFSPCLSFTIYTCQNQTGSAKNNWYAFYQYNWALPSKISLVSCREGGNVCGWVVLGLHSWLLSFRAEEESKIEQPLHPVQMASQI